MKNLIFSAVGALVLGLTAGPAAQAQVRTPVINARQANQRARIRQGVATGELTRTEAARMRGREAAIRANKQVARADGVVTPGERQGIRREENKTSRAIHRQKHDAQVR